VNRPSPRFMVHLRCEACRFRSGAPADPRLGPSSAKFPGSGVGGVLPGRPAGRGGLHPWAGAKRRTRAARCGTPRQVLKGNAARPAHGESQPTSSPAGDGPMNASGIEARRAETAHAGSVHESSAARMRGSPHQSRPCSKIEQ